jgi:hypothetical protein
MTTNSDLTLIIMAVIFIIVLVVSYRSLSQMFDFGDGATLVLAICVAALSVIGLSDMTPSLGVNDGNTENPGFSFKFNFILLPYILLPLAIIVTLIIRWIRKLRWYYKKGHHNEYPNG